MASVEDLIAQGESLCGQTGGARVLELLEHTFRSFGVTHFLVSGMPFPGRPIEPLLLRLNWGDLAGDRRTGIRDDDPVLQRAFPRHRTTIWRENADGPMENQAESLLLSQLGPPGGRQLVMAPVCSFLPYQAVVVGGGYDLAIDTKTATAVDFLCLIAFCELFKLGFLKKERPGELSGRERRVVELSAAGKTASQIAAILEISQRTVHAHLQNASEKLRAHNKTQTVVEALRYGQISM